MTVQDAFALAPKVWKDGAKLHDYFNMDKEATLEEAVAAKTFLWNNDVGWTFDSLPAGPLGKGGSCPTAHASPTCAKCYAQVGRFAFDGAQRALRRNWLLRKSSLYVLRTGLGFLWLAERVQRANGWNRGVRPVNGEMTLLVREHSSGDYPSRKDIQKDINLQRWLQACWPEDAPSLRVWVPTRVWPVMPMLTLLRQLQAEGDERVAWVVKPSSLDDGPAPQVEGLAAGSAVGLRQNAFVCPKITNHSNCAAQQCTACWQGTVQVTYPLHGAAKNREADERTLVYKERLMTEFKIAQDPFFDQDPDPEEELEEDFDLDEDWNDWQDEWDDEPFDDIGETAMVERLHGIY